MFVIKAGEQLNTDTLLNLCLLFEMTDMIKENILKHTYPGFCFLRALEEAAQITKENISYITDGLEEINLHKVAKNITKIHIKYCDVKHVANGKNRIVDFCAYFIA